MCAHPEIPLLKYSAKVVPLGEVCGMLRTAAMWMTL